MRRPASAPSARPDSDKSVRPKNIAGGSPLLDQDALIDAWLEGQERLKNTINLAVRTGCSDIVDPSWIEAATCGTAPSKSSQTSCTKPQGARAGMRPTSGDAKNAEVGTDRLGSCEPPSYVWCPGPRGTSIAYQEGTGHIVELITPRRARAARRALRQLAHEKRCKPDSHREMDANEEEEDMKEASVQSVDTVTTIRSRHSDLKISTPGLGVDLRFVERPEVTPPRKTAASSRRARMRTSSFAGRP